MTEVLQQDDGKHGKFHIAENGKDLAYMTYTWAGTDKFIIDHTDVNPILKGQGIGLRLVEAAVLFAREKGIKIIPLCPFAKATLDKHSEWQDIL
ncbi:GNAT family N-acetyltransferase [Zhouia amylolytica]|uniref:Acyl-CoA N-acyltransferase n=2 Tax=Zhouia amylolytica TaxID=376730 RepID=W2UP25_9FLAO|nr:GNAT family N-acetyltransferase [Zhouia amylolytica]ETN95097.1 acyl-CoA N-acyltransferase [Zhouia amylolytica AD3]MCQ0111815.1 N-acetyltransferase [Zhouia amylolytica]